MSPAWYIAITQFGTKGVPGSEHNKKILKYFADIGHSWVQDDETAWCAAFVNWCLLKAGKPQTGKLNARSFLQYGEPTTKPRIGDIVVLWRIKPSSPYGHVGFYFTEDKNHVYILGGNQSNAVNVAAFPKSQVLGYRTIVE